MRRVLLLTLVLAFVAVPAVAQSPNGLDPDDVGGLYLGGSFDGDALTSVTRQSFVYGECVPRRGVDQGCEFPLQLRRVSACERNPLELDGEARAPASRRYLARGAIVASYPGGGPVEISTGVETLLVYSTGRLSPRRVVAALRPVAGPWRLDRDLPRPVLPSSVVRDVEEARSAHERAGSVSRAARRLRLTRAQLSDRLGLGRRIDALGRVRTARC